MHPSRKPYPRIVFWAFWALFIFSCSLEKRRYFKGYHVFYAKEIASAHAKKKNNDFKNNNQRNSELNGSITTEEILKMTSKETEVGTTSASRDYINEERLHKKTIVFYTTPSDSCKDELIFKNGERLKVQILETTPYLVRFHNCNLPEGTVSEIPKSDLSVILPYQGKAEILNGEKKNSSVNSVKPSGSGTRLHEEVIIGLILLLTLPFLGALYIVIRYKKVKNAIQSNPDKYDGLEIWNFLYYLSIICLALVLLFIFLIIAALSSM